MRVAFDVGPLRPNPSGVGQYVRSLAGALAGLEGPAAVELCLIGRRPEAEGLPPSVPSLPRSTVMPYPAWVELRGASAVGAAHADLAHFTDGLVPLVRRRPTVVTVLDLSIVRQWRTHRLVRYPRIPLVLAAPRLAARVLVPSRATADEVIALTGTPARRIDVVPLAPFAGAADPGRGEDALRAYRLAPGGYLLLVGTIEPRKNHVRVLHAVERLVAERRVATDLEIAVAGGTGWHAGPILRALAASPLAGRIRLLGYVPDRDVPVLMAQAAAVVYASTYEGFGLPVLEAMSQGAAVVTSNVSSMPEVAGDAAILVDPLDEASIAEGIVTALAAGPDLGVAARRRAALFSWARTAGGTRATYERALA